MSEARHRVLVDTDPALLTWGLDVDDDLALLFLLASPEVELLAVTTTYGNTASPLAYRDAQRLLAMAGRSDVPVARGAGRLSRDPRETQASRLIVEVVRRHPGEVTLVTLGPLTNVQAASRAWPELGAHVKELVMLGGRSREGLSEFNFRAHPEATHAALALDCPKSEITFDLCFAVAITEAHIARLAAATGSVVARFAPKLRRFARFQDAFRRWRGRVPGQATGGFHPWDAVGAAWLVAPELFGDVQELYPDVDRDGRTRFSGSGARGKPVRTPGSLDAGAFLELFLARVAAPCLVP